MLCNIKTTFFKKTIFQSFCNKRICQILHIANPKVSLQSN